MYGCQDVMDEGTLREPWNNLNNLVNLGKFLGTLISRYVGVFTLISPHQTNQTT